MTSTIYETASSTGDSAAIAYFERDVVPRTNPRSRCSRWLRRISVIANVVRTGTWHVFHNIHLSSMLGGATCSRILTASSAPADHQTLS